MQIVAMKPLAPAFRSNQVKRHYVDSHCLDDVMKILELYYVELSSFVAVNGKVFVYHVKACLKLLYLLIKEHSKGGIRNIFR